MKEKDGPVSRLLEGRLTQSGLCPVVFDSTDGKSSGTLHVFQSGSPVGQKPGWPQAHYVAEAGHICISSISRDSIVKAAAKMAIRNYTRVHIGKERTCRRLQSYNR